MAGITYPGGTSAGGSILGTGAGHAVGHGILRPAMRGAGLGQAAGNVAGITHPGGPIAVMGIGLYEALAGSKLAGGGGRVLSAKTVTVAIPGIGGHFTSHGTALGALLISKLAGITHPGGTSAGTSIGAAALGVVTRVTGAGTSVGHGIL